MMTKIATLKSPRRSVTISVNADLLSLARQFDVSLSATLEWGLVIAINKRQADQWKIRHQTAIQSYNAWINERGDYSDGQRSF